MKNLLHVAAAAAIYLSVSFQLGHAEILENKRDEILQNFAEELLREESTLSLIRQDKYGTTDLMAKNDQKNPDAIIFILDFLNAKVVSLMGTSEISHDGDTAILSFGVNYLERSNSEVGAYFPPGFNLLWVGFVEKIEDFPKSQKHPDYKYKNFVERIKDLPHEDVYEQLGVDRVISKKNVYKLSGVNSIALLDVPQYKFSDKNIAEYEIKTPEKARKFLQKRILQKNVVFPKEFISDIELLDRIQLKTIGLSDLPSTIFEINALVEEGLSTNEGKIVAQKLISMLESRIKTEAN